MHSNGFAGSSLLKWTAIAVLGCTVLGKGTSGATREGPATPATAPPDIVILLTDQQTGSAMSIAGTPMLHTPAMDQLAREGVRFTSAFCATPQCSPSRAAIVTGRYPHRTGVMGNVQAKPPAGQSPPLDLKIPSLGKIFSAAGYETAYFGKWHLGNKPSQYGFATDKESPGRLLAPGVVEFLESRRQAAATRRKPLLLFVSWINPHDIYNIGRKDRLQLPPISEVRLPESLKDDLRAKPKPQSLYRDEDQGKPLLGYTEKDWREYIAYYNQLTENVDAEIGQVVGEVRKSGRDTIILFSSDHGDLGGAHKLPFKCPAMYEELVRIPLAISWPGKIQPAVCDALVNNIDYLPTLCELAGIEPPRGMDGISLKPLLFGQTDPTRGDAVFVEYFGKQSWRSPIRMVRTREWKYVRYLGFGEELYDLSADPHELNNLAGNNAHKAKQQELADRLERWMAQTKDVFPQLTVTDREGRVLRAGAEK